MVLATTLALSTFAPISNANAGGKHKGDLLAIGIVGLALGAVIADNHRYRQRRVDHLYYNQPVYTPPQPVARYSEPYYEPRFQPRHQPRYNKRHQHRPQRGNYYDESYPTDYSSYDQPRDITPPQHNRRQIYQPAPLPRDDGPKVITYNDAPSYSSQPWSTGWLKYCRAKFRSFNAKSGTYLGYDGNRHFCVVK